MHMFGGFGMIFMIIFWGFIIALFFSLAPNRSAESTSPQAETSFDTVKKRFASGEISREEFKKMVRELA
jgi:putative membrane protein